MKTFEFIFNSPRVLFGKGTLAQIRSLVDELGAKSVMLLSTPEQADIVKRVADILGDVAVSIFTGAVMHTPVQVTESALRQANEASIDCVVSVGGGSTIGLGKAICVRTGLVHVCVPTTYAGSEMTPILGETENGRKVTRRDSKILPTAVVYDVDLTLTLPVKMSVNSGINAIAHSVEALYASNTNPIINVMACEGIRSLSEALPILQTDPQNNESRYKALYGAWLCGLCLGAVDMALHHKLCHTLGGSFNLPHAETHVVVLPHALAFNAPSDPEAMSQLAAVLPESQGDAVRGINALYRRLGIDMSLKVLGMQEESIDKAADVAVSNPYRNPRPLERDALREVLRRAWSGEQAKQDL
ncbi:probable alcohol dehydrogenase, class IV [Fusarium mangiferae]|uniref:Probable alcohol dehydrogenase, class IV n=1 Tax=Fusarium mangiferae TaxID=192010 RepID=A0A1L7TMW4_FUSMA|nr:putative alcohol dehydrogenase, class IV [Fusarium mangiferae]CVK96627.1 probable alcohol dehydrogenase, class IV [Fusarium mangiferae]